MFAWLRFYTQACEFRKTSHKFARFTCFSPPTVLNLTTCVPDCFAVTVTSLTVAATAGPS